MNTNKPVEPVSHVIPESVAELLEVVKIQSDTIALRLYILRAEADIKAAYARIAELDSLVGSLVETISGIRVLVDGYKCPQSFWYGFWKKEEK